MITRAQRVVVGVDGTEGSIEALRWAAHEAARRKWPLHVITCAELPVAVEAGLVGADQHFDELGAVIAGQAPGRTSNDEITFADLTGTGVQDTAIANLAVSRARDAGCGQTIDNKTAKGDAA